MSIQLTPAQAGHLATLLRQIDQAKAAYAHDLGVLMLGHTVPDGALGIVLDAETGMLTFQMPVIPAETPPDGD